MMLVVSCPSVKSLPESRTATGEHTVCDGWGWPEPCRKRVEIYFEVLAVEMKTYLIQTMRMIVDGYIARQGSDGECTISKPSNLHVVLVAWI